MEDQLILVDEKDTPIGTMGKLETHQKGLLHRAFSLFIFNDKNQLMLQQRALSKYHCRGLWTNTVCSHQLVDESMEQAIHRKLQQEMGIDCELKKIHEFIYRVEFDNGLTEHEYDHVFIGRYNEAPNPNPEEAHDWRWVTLDDLQKEIEAYPEKFSYWMKEILPVVKKFI